MKKGKSDKVTVKLPPFETEALRREVQRFFETEVRDPLTEKQVKVGNYRFGVYAFFDYDGEPIYVGQTNERLRTRIGRHLTNQRTDAVAMNVLDPFEVFEIEVWPLPQFQKAGKKDRGATNALNALEYAVFQHELRRSRFKAVLNEKEPPRPKTRLTPKFSYRARIVSEDVEKIRSHPDVRIARRASVLARLAQVISERQVSRGLRKTLLTQARRLEWLAKRRHQTFASRA